MSFIKQIFKHDKSGSQRTKAPKSSSGVICLDNTAERGFHPDGSRKSFAEAARTAHHQIDCPSRLQNYLSTPKQCDERAYFEEPDEINDLRPVYIDKVDEANGVKHTTAWFVCTYDLLEYADDLPRGEFYSASLPIKEAINFFHVLKHVLSRIL